MNKVHEATKEYLIQDIPEFDAGDTVVVNVRVQEAIKSESNAMKGL